MCGLAFSDFAFLSPHIPNSTVAFRLTASFKIVFIFYLTECLLFFFFSSQPTQNYPSGLTSSENISSSSSHLTACQCSGLRGYLFLLMSLCDSHLYFFSSLLYSAAGLGWSVKPIFAAVPEEELIELLSSNYCQDDVLSTKVTQQEVVISLGVGEK